VRLKPHFCFTLSTSHHDHHPLLHRPSRAKASLSYARHKTWGPHFTVTRSVHAGGDVYLPEYNGDYPDDTNVPYIPGVSPGIKGPLPPNPCIGPAAGAACLISLFTSLVPMNTPVNTDPNFSITFDADYQEAVGIPTITLSEMQYTNRGEMVILNRVTINDNDVFADNSYMPTDGTYYPIPESGGNYNSNNPLSVNVALFIVIPTSNGTIGIPKNINITLPSLPELQEPFGD
jgi:hypothetical protein